MLSRSDLLRDWRERLEADEAQVVAAGARFAWLLRARARIYRLLLAMYGDEVWRSDCDVNPPGTSSAAGSASIQGTARVEQERGRPPKSAADIRKRLKSVHLAVEPIAPGDAEAVRTACRQLARKETGASPSPAWGSVATCHVARLRWRLRQVFDRLGIPYEVHGPHIYVPDSERSWALALIRSERYRRKFNIPAELLGPELPSSATYESIGSFPRVEDRELLMRVFGANQIAFQCRGTYVFVPVEDATAADLILEGEYRLGRLGAKHRSAKVQLFEQVRLIVTIGICAYGAVLVLCSYGHHDAAERSLYWQASFFAMLLFPLTLLGAYLLCRLGFFPRKRTARNCPRSL